MRFCARCGFPLAGAMVLLTHGGMLPHYEAPATARQKVRRVAKVLSRALC